MWNDAMFRPVYVLEPRFLVIFPYFPRLHLQNTRGDLNLSHYYFSFPVPVQEDMEKK
jgi:hypothetical protein